MLTHLKRLLLLCCWLELFGRSTRLKEHKPFNCWHRQTNTISSSQKRELIIKSNFLKIHIIDLNQWKAEENIWIQ